MSKPRTLESKTIPFPSDGLNLIASPDQFLPTEARILDNYFIFDWGIRERSSITTVNTPDGLNIISMIQYYDTSNLPNIFVSTASHTYTYSIIYGFSAAKSATAFVHPCIFNKKIFIVDGATQVSSLDMATAAYTAGVFTPSNKG